MISSIDRKPIFWNNLLFLLALLFRSSDFVFNLFSFSLSFFSLLSRRHSRLRNSSWNGSINRGNIRNILNSNSASASSVGSNNSHVAGSECSSVVAGGRGGGNNDRDAAAPAALRRLPLAPPPARRRGRYLANGGRSLCYQCAGVHGQGPCDAAPSVCVRGLPTRACGARVRARGATLVSLWCPRV